MIYFKSRTTEKELMDEPNIKAATLQAVLADVDRSNRWLGGNTITQKAVARLIKLYPQKEYVIVDVGCGEGAILRRLADYCRHQGINARFVGLDLSDNAIDLARKHSVNYPNISFLQQDILELDPEKFDCDLLLCTLTMHHFSDQQLPVFLDKFKSLARIAVIINDLQRSRIAYYLFKVFSAIFIKTKIAKHDGLISIRSGFLRNELELWTKEIINFHHEITWKWAFRYLWVMRAPNMTKK